MSLADEMKNISDSVRDSSDEFNSIYNKCMERIRACAKDGKREMCWYDNGFYYDFDNPNRAKYLDMLKRKLEDNGFKVRYGYQIGKPVYNSQSEYIVW